MSETQEWHLISAVDHQQYGPYTAEQLQGFAADGTVTRDTLVWTEALADWIPASSVEGLFPGPAAPPHPAPPGPAPTAIPPSQPAALGAGAGPLGAPPAAGFGPQVVPPGELYPPPGFLKASFGLLLTLAVLTSVCLLTTGALFWTRLKESSFDLAELGESMKGSAPVMIGGVVLVVICLAAYRVLSCLYLYRAWKALQWGQIRTSPGKAVGFLFIPVFNLYWIFVAYPGLAKDWNRIMASHPNLAYAPRLNAGLAVTYCILVIVSLAFSLIDFDLMVSEGGPTVLGLVMGGLIAGAVLFELMVYSGICKGVRFMGNLHIAQLQQAAGGLRLY